jgi:hypothetical protein
MELPGGIRQIALTEDAICGTRDEVGIRFQARSEELWLVRSTYQFAVLRVIPGCMLCSLAAAALAERRRGRTHEAQTEPDGVLGRLTRFRLSGLRRLKWLIGLAVEPPGSLHARSEPLEPTLLAGPTLVALELDPFRLGPSSHPAAVHRRSCSTIRGRAKEFPGRAPPNGDQAVLNVPICPCIRDRRES